MGFFGGGSAFPYKVAFGLIFADATFDPNSVHIDGATVSGITGDYQVDVTSAGFTTFAIPVANCDSAAAGNGVIAVPAMFSLTLVTVTMYDNTYLSKPENFSLFVIGY